MSIDHFVLNVPQRTLDDLHDRLVRTRWTDEITDGWTFGTDRVELRAPVEHWTCAFDWRRQEAAINRFAQFHADVHGDLASATGVGRSFLQRSALDRDAARRTLCRDGRTRTARR